MSEGDERKGLYRKYELHRLKRVRNQRDEMVEVPVRVIRPFFALVEGDPYAPIALTAYAQACEQTYPKLAAELRDQAQRWLTASRGLDGETGVQQPCP